MGRTARWRWWWSRWRKVFGPSLLILVALSLTLSQLQAPPGGARERSDRTRRQVRRVCKSLNVSTKVTQDHLRNILVDDARGILYCSAHKVASSSWKRSWLQLTSSTFNASRLATISRHTTHLLTQQFMLVQPRFEDVWPDMLASYRKFLFVREPLHRVVSAYRDKLEHPTDMEDLEISPYIKKLISEKFGTLPTQVEEGVSFSDFVKLINHQKEEESIPWDSHWRPIHQMCNPCGIDYDFIGKVESLHEDSTYVLKWLGVEKIVEKFPVHSRSTEADRLAIHYLQGLDYSLRKEFLDHYLLDYLSFEYDLV
ncbi:carbohydrate sulfotransferase 11 [Procambarus clarkii]|uniref:carbohydrate sulfotransferase 11 n=1 Tax=Procambarus clarkii TaxID=6728 RepID=UPI001E67197D|nr:carbohydrate sulfotransferase 11-like [Procambarus clarkii]